MLKIYNVEYFSLFDAEKYPGIFRKIDDTVRTLNNSGCEAKNRNFQGTSYGFRALTLELLKSKADVIIIRNFFQLPILLFVFLYLRLMGKYLVIDIPTPLTVVLREFELRENMAWMAICARKIIVSIFYPLSLLPFNRIIQYAGESRYFSFGVKNKIKLLSNGIEVARYKIKRKDISLERKCLTLLAVAKVSSWHGLDRVLVGISNYVQESPRDVAVKFYIAGDGDAIKELKSASERLGIAESVFFLGFKSHGDLDSLFDIADIGISTLGLYRKGMQSASSLKTREYVARGMPLVVSGDDIDLEPIPNFAFHVSNDDRPVNIRELIHWYEGLGAQNVEKEGIRNFALEHMDLKTKVKWFLPS